MIRTLTTILLLIYVSSLLYAQTQTPLATGQDKFLGNIYSTSQLPNFTQYWNQVTPENAGKWGSVERTRNVMDWTELDAAYKLAKDNNFPFRFHVLVWGNQQPVWMQDLSQGQQLQEIDEWFKEVAKRYPDIDYLEVVNEPINDPPRKKDANDNDSGNYFEALGGAGTTGYDWIIKAFEMAREHFPATTKLMINEYNILSNATLANNYVNIINLLKQRNLIDAVGIQGHAFSTRVTNEVIKSNLDKVAATGLPIQITEFDIDGPTDQEQLTNYRRIVPLLWTHPAVKGITLWGWRPGMWRTDQKAYLINPNGTERPAMVWLRNYISGITNTDEPISNEIKVFPNPALNGNVTISGAQNINQIRILDMAGNKVKELNSSNQRVVELELQVSPGIYIIQLVDGSKSEHKKLVVK
jgi:endo-1,4-beta-xylanase